MSPYFLLFIFLIFSSFIQSKFYKLEKTTDIIASIVLIIFLGARYEVGGDWVGYYFLLQSSAQGQYFNASEPFFLLITKISLLFPTAYQYLTLNTLLAMSLIGCLLYIKQLNIKNNFYSLTKLTVLIFPIFIFLLGTGYLRQAVACALFVPVLHFAKQLEYKKSLGLVLLSLLFHKSALIFLIAPFLTYLQNQNCTLRQINKKYYIYIFLFISVCLAFTLKWASAYTNQSMNSYGVFIRYIYITLLGVPLLIIFKNQLIQFFLKYKIQLIILFTTTMFISYHFSTFIDRLLIYFIIPVAYYSLKYSQDSQNKNLIRAYFVLMIAINFIYTFAWLKFSYWGPLKWLPYQNYFFNINY